MAWTSGAVSQTAASSPVTWRKRPPTLTWLEKGEQPQREAAAGWGLLLGRAFLQVCCHMFAGTTS